ncbi:Pkinase-domain-containing protein [Testicularia cyperi]|uniref:Pkinase-domain-containing protein n=1 Tax=Testicularia cyperi TaxID=1882483 RepID=A0A317XFN8_9BASI|nr:Pkinase-domain-containing protein [Testicularia cyperi]
MSQFLSGSPEGDDQLPSFMESMLRKRAADSKDKAQQSADPRQGSSHAPSIPPTDSSSPSKPCGCGGRSHQHSQSGHGHSHSHSHGHSHSSGHSHGHSHSHSHGSASGSQTGQQYPIRSNTKLSQGDGSHFPIRGMSMASNSSLGVPGSSSDRSLSRSATRTPSFEYRETLDAKSKDMDDGSRIINQYKMCDIIGQGAYGTVHKACLTDDPSVQFAIKEFGKTRLRKNNRSSKFRRPGRGRGPGFGRSEPPNAENARKDEDADETKDPLSLIRHEIAILKKLHHPHVVKLYEVLDDPSKDSLYMVFEFCPDGKVIDIRLNETVEPLPEEPARCYFIQILLGVEYLHENDIVHRDIKPDNILLSEDRTVCKIVDFGVSEMFLKPGDDTMEKSAGSPAFMSPELCTAGHGAFHGKLDDIWSFGVTLYCMVVGHLPFNKDNFYEMYEAIKNDEPEYPDFLSENLVDLLKRMLTKDPNKRITVPEIREHPWVLEAPEGQLLSKEENLEKLVIEITEEELDCAICKITNIFTFARAISRFKKGGSVARAKREATRSTSGGSQGHERGPGESAERDKSWFPPSLSRTGTSLDTIDTQPTSIDETNETATIREDKEASDSKEVNEKDSAGEKGTSNEQKQRNQEPQLYDDPEELQDFEQVKKAATALFENHCTSGIEMPREEPHKNGPLQRVPTAPSVTLHRPAAAMDRPALSPGGSQTPDLVASPTSEDGPDEYIRVQSVIQEDEGDEAKRGDNVKADVEEIDDHVPNSEYKDEGEMLAKLSKMVLEQQNQHPRHGEKHHDVQREISIIVESPGGGDGAGLGHIPPWEQRQNDQAHSQKKDDDEEGGNDGKDERERSRTTGVQYPKPKARKPLPKVLPDQPTVASPFTVALKTPPGAGNAYVAAVREDERDNPYFKNAEQQSKTQTLLDGQDPPLRHAESDADADEDGDNDDQRPTAAAAATA